ncbi:uncharacterized protein LOC111709131 [Eurytemora carolleeae]|uniref:uncharacterized protein LOC111709131 n=1 Tax=Eurytemora carolleeae TaxID=1294199 RepID=UPI000C7639A7|nr:uncharacterized protein LOC111709131 [Eurytemora carolleeae]|eukprot:XP_023338506.1 uncharacterized protein LOC111709131 [Eurytemora affinis]
MSEKAKKKLPDSDIEKNLGFEDEDEETRLQREQEAEIQKNKARQAFLENMYVLIAMVLIVVLAVVTVVLKALLFTEEQIVTFIPLQQQVRSSIKYAGNGYIPCNGFVPTPTGCDYEPYQVNMPRPY